MAKKLSASNSSSEIDLADLGVNTISNFTIKVWMEDASSLAKATVLVTFVGIKKTDKGNGKNIRVFAMKIDLKCSLGELPELSVDSAKNVIAGNGQDDFDGVACNTICGKKLTYQKIYFGTRNGVPREF